MTVILDLEILSGGYAISRLQTSAPIPDWADGPDLLSLTRAQDELSIVCPEGRVPEGVETSGGWTAIRLTTTFDFDEPGVVLSVVQPISGAGLGIFVISTFLRDYVLVRTSELLRVKALLLDAGHQFL